MCVSITPETLDGLCYQMESIKSLAGEFILMGAQDAEAAVEELKNTAHIDLPVTQNNTEKPTQLLVFTDLTVIREETRFVY